MSDAREKALVAYQATFPANCAGTETIPDDFNAGWAAAKADLPDRETVAEAIFNHNAEARGSGVRFSTATERMKATSYEYADVVLSLLRGETKP